MTSFYREEYVKCGKKGCHCRHDQGHGPYWYYYYTDRRNKLHKKYCGKRDPRQQHFTWGDEDDYIRKAIRDALESAKNIRELHKTYRSLAKLHHPDKGGTTRNMQEVNRVYRERLANL